jgi:hypothetical protein
VLREGRRQDRVLRRIQACRHRRAPIRVHSDDAGQTP